MISAPLIHASKRVGSTAGALNLVYRDLSGDELSYWALRVR